MRQFPIIFVLISLSISTFGQVTFSSSPGKPIQKLKTIDLRTQKRSEGFIQYLEYPRPGGDAYHEFLKTQKEKASLLFPKRNEELPRVRSLVDPPELVRNFSGNSFTAGIPLDNHLAVNRDDKIVTVVNTQLLAVGPTGIWLESYSLDDFWSDLGETEFYFDPRVIFDPLEDRFIMAMMQDGNCGGSNIVFAFSATSDPTGAWHLYQFSGCPNNDATFADFPMISLTKDELFFTYNAVYQDSTWQSGFNETLIYQINKYDGYAGDTLRWRSWSNITHNNRKLRYIHPVKHATEDLPSECYFLSNRSFDIQNDTVFLVHITGNMDAPDLALTVQAMKSDMPYGVPPSAEQPKDFLQTNDGRVLDAFYFEDQIQFVSSTMDPLTGRSGVYHGIVSDVSSAPALHATILRNGSDHFAYPGIAHTGALSGERDAIIIATHASTTRFPGYSALYYDEGYSEWIPVKEGLRNIDMLKEDNPFGLDPTLERWGDYSGIQRQYAEEGTVYTASCYGKPGNVNDTWIGYLRRPGKSTALHSLETDQSTLSTFPNPASQFVIIETDVHAVGKLLTATLYDINGVPIRNVFDRRISQNGSFRFYYNTSTLNPGNYLLGLALDGMQFASRIIVIQ